MNDKSEQAASNPACLNSMDINDNKAGMENIDKEKINAIILKHSQSIRVFKIQKKPPFL